MRDVEREASMLTREIVARSLELRRRAAEGSGVGRVLARLLSFRVRIEYGVTRTLRLIDR
jgi:hypothetical protein